MSNMDLGFCFPSSITMPALVCMALLFCNPLSAQDTVPLIGRTTIDESPTDHGCSPTDEILRGSTHWYYSFRDEYRPNGTVPDLEEVECSTNPVEIVRRSLEWDPVGNYRAYYIQLWVRANAEGIGRLDIGGVGPCYRVFRGLAWYKNQKEPGDVFGVQCFQLGNKYYDAHAELSKVINDAEICRVIFLDKRGMKGEFKDAWYNHDEPVCKGMRAIDPIYFCRENQWWRHPNAIRAEDICDGTKPRGRQ